MHGCGVMKDLRYLDAYRREIPEVSLSKGEGDPDPRCNGAFIFKMGSEVIVVVVGRGRGWEHVSVSCRDRTPTWAEMEKIKRLFFEEHEVCMQLHVAVKDHINVHPNVLHIWRPVSKLKPIPLPPKDLV